MKIDPSSFQSGTSARGNGHNLQQGQFSLCIRKICSTSPRVVQDWHRGPEGPGNLFTLGDVQDLP